MTRRPTPDAERLYRLLLRLYPPEFRARYGRMMTDFHRDRVAAAQRSGESMFILWLRTIADVVASAGAEHAQSFTMEDVVLETVVQDLAYAIRGLARRPAFAALVIATMALGIGANAAIFSVVNGVLLRPLPYPNPERVVSFGHDAPQWLISVPAFLDYRRDLQSFDGLAAYTRNDVTITSGDTPERARMVRASEDFFPVLGVQPLLGRTFAANEYAGNPPTVVVLSYGLWQRRFAGDRSIIGQTMSIGGIARTIVGVMPPRFDFPEARTDLWSPMPPVLPDGPNTRGNYFLSMVGRLRPGVTLERAVTEADRRAQQMMRDFPELFNPTQPLRPHLARVSDQLVQSTRPYLFALLGAVGFVLLIACANVANLLLVRGESRQKEMAVRSALGASGFRLLSQLVTESTVLAVAGGLLGLVMAWGGDRALIALAPASIPRLDAIAIDWRVVAFTTAITLMTGFAVGLVPGWRALRDQSADALKDGGRATASHGVMRGARRMLVAAEVALAVVTLSGAGMMVRSLWNLQRAELGFDPRGVLTAKVSLSPREYNDARSVLFFDELRARVSAVPGVTSVGAAGWLPVVDAGGLRSFNVEGRAYPEGQQPMAVPQQATPGFFKAIGLPLIAGRDIAETDGDGALPVVVVSQRFATMLWPGQAALGHRIKLDGPAPWMTIVGVVGDLRARGFDDTPEPTMFFPYAQAAKSTYYAPRAMALVVRAGGAAGNVATPLRDAVRAIDRTVPVSEVRTLEEVVGTSVANRRFSTMLLAGFAALALVLAGIGTYGVISYGVTQRSFEIGVRMALGAEDRRVLALVLSEGVRMCVVGLAVGLAASAGLGRALRALLVGVSAIDMPTLAVTSAALLVVAVLACVIPARRAMKVSPLEVLRGG